MHTLEIEKKYPEVEPTLHDVIQIMQRGFGRIDTKFGEIEVRFEKIDDKFDSIDTKFEKINKRFDGMDSRLDVLDSRFDRMDKRFDDMDARFDALTTDVRSCQRTLGNIDIQIEDMVDTVLNHEERLVKLEMRP